MTSEETKRWIWDRCTECGNCLLWDGAVDACGVPQMRLPGDRKVQATRRVLLAALGRKVKGLLATTRCDEPRCMAERHIVAWTRKQLQTRNGKKYAGSITRAAKLRAATLRHSKLTMDDAKAIREVGMDYRQIMERFGVCKSTAYNVIAGRHWPDHSNPFAALMASNDSTRRATA